MNITNLFILDWKSFSGYRSESSFAIFAWKVTWLKILKEKCRGGLLSLYTEILYSTEIWVSLYNVHHSLKVAWSMPVQHVSTDYAFIRTVQSDYTVYSRPSTFYATNVAWQDLHYWKLRFIWSTAPTSRQLCHTHR